MKSGGLVRFPRGPGLVTLSSHALSSGWCELRKASRSTSGVAFHTASIACAGVGIRIQGSACLTRYGVVRNSLAAAATDGLNEREPVTASAAAIAPSYLVLKPPFRMALVAVGKGGIVVVERGRVPVFFENLNLVTIYSSLKCGHKKRRALFGQRSVLLAATAAAKTGDDGIR